MDSSMPTDSDVPDTSEPDAAPECVCPGLPACSGVIADTPAFTPEGTAYVDQLFQVIACADSTLDAAIYQTTYDCVVDALETKLAADTDLVVRLIIDDDMCPVGAGGVRDCPLSRIESNPRVTIVDDARSSLMHHKFMIADGSHVWVGSGNMTYSSFCTDMNNAIVVDQAEIIAGYQAAFDQMFGGDFSPQPVGTPVTGGAYTLYTSPRTPISSPSPWFDALVAAIGDATTVVEVMTSAWTRTEVSDALIAARGRGVMVRALVRSSYVDDAPAQALIAAGIDVRHGNVHSKVAIIDDHLVVTGSPNWSMNAWSNSEASLFIDDASIAGAYSAEMARGWALGMAP
jgi:phosphatidylserine/phosphatidylglycerophosphate/cardiolipin synthase-like enzyme